ncbi:MAG: tRNA preQ1(34) S-adenosylmethionine ribosyltransferase-isomerase QueA [Planctomycetota bacterium]|jgi:S-adenosylmethionine:tRNA ribosyltransferase-isomerase
MTDVALFDYELPETLIAATPAERRDESRLLVLERRSGTAEHRWFFDLPDLLREGDLVVMNDAQVIPARLRARRRSGGAVELLLVRPAGLGPEAGPADPSVWRALVRSSGRLRAGEELQLDGLEAYVTLLRRREEGAWTVRLGNGRTPPEAILEAGAMPLPPYVIRARLRRGMPSEMPELDAERYQTVYASTPGAVAAPTAGLHFTEDLLERLHGQGVQMRMISLLVGPGTFRPVRSERVEDHRLPAEHFHLPAGTAGAVGDALAQGRRVVAVGTTVCRVLETVARWDRWEECSGWTDLFIYPPFEFRAVGALITNFHLPRSTLLMLVAAFAGRGNVLGAYREAIREGYRFSTATPC